MSKTSCKYFHELDKDYTVCYGTREMEKCSCDGDENKCDFYPDKRKEEPMTNDNVNHPSHYNQGGIECIEAIEVATTGLDGIESFCTGNAIKYLWRWKHKNGVEDLKKAIWYINKLIERIELNG